LDALPFIPPSTTLFYIIFSKYSAFRSPRPMISLSLVVICSTLGIDFWNCFHLLIDCFTQKRFELLTGHYRCTIKTREGSQRRNQLFNMAPHATHDVQIEAVTDTQAAALPDPVLSNGDGSLLFTIDDVLPHRQKSAPMPSGVAAFASADMFKSKYAFRKPKAKRWDHRISIESRARQASSLKGAMKYFRPCTQRLLPIRVPISQGAGVAQFLRVQNDRLGQDLF